MAFCDLWHTFHKQVTNVSPACFCHRTVGNFDISPKYGTLGQKARAHHPTQLNCEVIRDLNLTKLTGIRLK